VTDFIKSDVGSKGKVKVTMPWRSTGGVELQLHTLSDLRTRWRWVVSFTPKKEPFVLIR